MAQEPNKRFFLGLARAFGSALIFMLPILMTMEMWELGSTLERWRILTLVVLSLPMLMFVSHYSGFEDTWGWREDARDVAIAFGTGIVVSILVLLLIGAIPPHASPDDIAGRIAIQAVPGALGALLGRSQFGEDSKKREEESYGGELGIMAVGAMFLGFNVAPTEEMLLISYRITPWQSLFIVPLSLVIMHGFVFAVDFKGGSERADNTPWFTNFLRYTVAGYAVALIAAAYVLWIFGRFEGHDLAGIIRVVVVLGFPAAIGAAAARLII